jgi:DNA-binding cell septation regulator SpoVG
MNDLHITNVNIIIKARSANRNQNVLGFAEVIVNDGLVIRNIKILKGKDGNGKLLSFPAQKARESDKWYDVCHPINNKIRKHFEEVIFRAYEKVEEAQPKP